MYACDFLKYVLITFRYHKPNKIRTSKPYVSVVCAFLIFQPRKTENPHVQQNKNKKGSQFCSYLLSNIEIKIPKHVSPLDDFKTSHRCQQHYCKGYNTWWTLHVFACDFLKYLSSILSCHKSNKITFMKPYVLFICACFIFNLR